MNSFIPTATGPMDAAINLGAYYPAMFVIGVLVFALSVKRLRLGGAVMLIGGLVVIFTAVLRFSLVGPEIAGAVSTTGLLSQFDDLNAIGVTVFIAGLALTAIGYLIGITAASGSLTGALFLIVGTLGLPVGQKTQGRIANAQQSGVMYEREREFAAS